MGATRFFILSTFLVLMFGFALTLPTIDVGDEVPEHGKYFFTFYTPTNFFLRWIVNEVLGNISTTTLGNM